MTTSNISRRSFIQSSNSIAIGTAISALSASRVLGANERLQIGIIGCGERGRNAHIKQILQYGDDQNVQITAVCDVWSEPRSQASGMVDEHYGEKPKEYENYEDLLANRDIDAVTIATPEHQHITQLIAAIEAGKDVYCEKPLARNMEELRRGVDTVKQSDRVVQIGTQLRSYASFTGCRKVVQEGQLGRILKASQVRNINEPYWFRYVKPIDRKDTNWDLFLMQAKKRAFDAQQHTGWYGYNDFSLGSIAAMMCHYIDLVHYITGKTYPISSVGLEGKYAYDDKFTNPDSVHVLLEYPGFMVSYSSVYGNGFGNYTRFQGEKGTIDATDWNEPFMTGEGSNHPDKIKSKTNVPHVESQQHMDNWLTCLRTREKPHADIDAGYQHAVACILANTAIHKNRKMFYDHEKREIVEG